MEKTIRYQNMKKTIVAALAALLCVSMASVYAKQARQLREVVFVTTMDCPKCEKKIMENVSFEKGVMDLQTRLADKTVTIVYDASRTDTLKLGNSIRKLGYGARAVSDKEKSKK